MEKRNGGKNQIEFDASVLNIKIEFGGGADSKGVPLFFAIILGGRHTKTSKRSSAISTQRKF